MYYINLDDFTNNHLNKIHHFEKIELDIEFKIPKHHRSIVSSVGDIILTGGFMND